jgi:hypothetical protein
LPSAFSIGTELALGAVGVESLAEAWLSEFGPGA